ncbi:MAG: hypothetical protein ACE5LX_01485 [Nitrospinota bacterium]
MRAPSAMALAFVSLGLSLAGLALVSLTNLFFSASVGSFGPLFSLLGVLAGATSYYFGHVHDDPRIRGFALRGLGIGLFGIAFFLALGSMGFLQE